MELHVFCVTGNYIHSAVSDLKVPGPKFRKMNFL